MGSEAGEEQHLMWVLEVLEVSSLDLTSVCYQYSVVSLEENCWEDPHTFVVEKPWESLEPVNAVTF